MTVARDDDNTFIVGLENIKEHVHVGQSVTLRCNVLRKGISGGITSVSWYKDGVEMDMCSPRYSLDADRMLMTIVDILKEDIGEYKCKIFSPDPDTGTQEVLEMQVYCE